MMVDEVRQTQNMAVEFETVSSYVFQFLPAGFAIDPQKSAAFCFLHTLASLSAFPKPIFLCQTISVVLSPSRERPAMSFLIPGI